GHLEATIVSDYLHLEAVINFSATFNLIVHFETLLVKQGVFIATAGFVAKTILTTFYSGNETVFATISCVASEFLQQSPSAQQHIYDDFLSHYSGDKPQVEALAARLEDEEGVKQFL